MPTRSNAHGIESVGAKEHVEAEAIVARDGDRAPRRRRGRPPKSFVLGQNEKGEDVVGTYADLGLTRQRAWRCRQLAAIPRDVLEVFLATRRCKGELKLAASFTGAATDSRVKIRTDDPARAAWVIAKNCSEGFVEELVGLLLEYLRIGAEPQEVA